MSCSSVAVMSQIRAKVLVQESVQGWMVFNRRLLMCWRLCVQMAVGGMGMISSASYLARK